MQVNNIRILLKLSGEALAEGNDFITNNKLNHFVQEISSIHKLGVQICIVVGGGNILRGANSKLNIARYKADNMGMLSTIINSIALQSALEANNIDSMVLNSFEVNKIVDFYTTQKSTEYLNNNKVVIFSGGTANPYFSTDMVAVIRSLENNCSLILKGTQVDGVYTADPKKNINAEKIPEVSFDTVIQNNLSVVDLSAVLLAKQNNLPIIIFNLHKPNNLLNVVNNVIKNIKPNLQSNYSIIN